MSKLQRILLVLLTVFCCIGCDQATKAVAHERLPRGEVVSLAGDTVRLQYAENRGAFLSLGDRLSEGWRTLLLVDLVAVFLALLLRHLLRSATMAPRSRFALSLVCGGGIGNLIDRAVRDGYVVDFLNCGVGGLRTGIFNVADVAITTGAVVLLVGGFAKR